MGVAAPLGFGGRAHSPTFKTLPLRAHGNSALTKEPSLSRIAGARMAYKGGQGSWPVWSRALGISNRR